MGSFRNKNAMPQIIYVLIYCRVSSLRQVKEGNGLEGQELRCRQYATAKGYVVEKVFKDEGVSGKLFNRPAFKAMLDHMDANPTKNYVVIFDDLKRFARDVVFHFKLKSELKARNAIPECLNFDFNDSPEGEFYEIMTAAQGQLERKQNQRQVCQKMKARLDKGCWCFCPPTGLTFIKTNEHGKVLIPKEGIANVLKEACEGFANDRFLQQVDVQRFLEKHKTTLGIKNVYLSFVERVLSNILYSGYVEYPDWNVARKKGIHNGFISIDTFNKNQEKLKKKDVKIKSSDNLEYPLRRLITCAICKKPMTSSNPTGKRLSYKMYTCNNTNCSAKPKNIQKDLLEKEYVNLLKSIKPDKEILVLVENIAKDIWNNKSKEIIKSEKSKEVEIKNKKSSINNYLDRIEKSKSEAVIENYETRIEELSKEIQELEKNKSTTPNISFERALKEVIHFIGTPSNYWINADIEEKHMVHNLVFTKNPHFDMQHKFGTLNLSLPFQLKKELINSKSPLVEMPGVEPGSKGADFKRLLL